MSLPTGEAFSLALARRADTPPRFPVWPVATAAFLVAANLAYGHVRLIEVERAMAEGTPLRVAVLQGNVDQNEKWRNRAVRRQTPLMYLEMAREANRDHDLSLIILPETALPIWQRRDQRLRRRIADFGIRTGTYVLFGCPTRESEGESVRVNYNSAGVVSPHGELLGWYHKNRLVPFGEYIPLKDAMLATFTGLDSVVDRFAADRSWRLEQLVAGTGNFRPWGRYSLLDIPEGSFGVIICFEAIFPDLVRRIANQGATFLPNITNDAWFGRTSAPHQHLAMVAIRAVENRLYIPRAANTGISGIVKPTGRIVHETGTYVKDYYVGEIRTMTMTSVYRRIGDLFAYLCAVVFAGLAAGSGIAAIRHRAGRSDEK